MGLITLSEQGILRNENIQHYIILSFSSDDGTSRQESGAPSSVAGSYSFITPEGEVVDMQYTADENGFHASGSHMPTTPPPPPHVQRLLDHLAKVNGGFL